MSTSVEAKPAYVRMLTGIAGIDRTLNSGDYVIVTDEIALAWVDAGHAEHVTKADFERAIKTQRMETRG
jgi:hypothetical protein